MKTNKRRIHEQQILSQMIGIFCKGNHSNNHSNNHPASHSTENSANSPTAKHMLCPECLELQTYAIERLQNCRYGSEKSFCSNCQTHCYRSKYRGQIKTVMRYAGPRILFSHPVMAINHLVETKKQIKNQKAKLDKARTSQNKPESKESEVKQEVKQG